MRNTEPVPATWKRDYIGVCEAYVSPNGNQGVRRGFTRNGKWGWRWWGFGESGESLYMEDAFRQLSRLGYLDGEFE